MEDRAALILHRIRIDCAVKFQTFGTSDDAEASLLALTSFINMVRDICNKFNMLSAPEKIPSAPLPAVMCTGEAVLAGIRMKELLGEQFQLDYEPFRLTLLYARKSWKLAGMCSTFVTCILDANSFRSIFATSGITVKTFLVAQIPALVSVIAHGFV